MATDEPAARFRGSRVLVTGGLGFIGSNLVRPLVAAGARVTLVDCLAAEYGGNRANIAGLEADVRVEIADLRDAARTDALVRGQDVVFNLAGQTSHLDSMADPYTDLEMNCRAQLSILEACRRAPSAPVVVFAGTRQIYGRPHYLPVDEEHPIDPVDVNGIHKAAAERYHSLYREVYGLRICTLRLTNTYGPRMRVKDARQTFLGTWLGAVIRGEPFAIWGDGSQRRDFTYVDDAVRAFLLAGSEPEADGEVFNLGGPPLSLCDVADLLVDVAGGGVYRVVPFPADRAAIDIGDYFADYDRIRSRLGWWPQVGMREGLARSLAFYREHGASYWDAAA